PRVVAVSTPVAPPALSPARSKPWPAPPSVPDHIPLRQFRPGHITQLRHLARRVHLQAGSTRLCETSICVTPRGGSQSSESTKTPSFAGVLDRFLTGRLGS